MPGALVTIGGLPLLIYPADRPLASSLGSGIDHVAFTCRDLDDTLASLRARRVPILREPYLVDGVRAAIIQGPDLIAIELLEAGP